MFDTRTIPTLAKLAGVLVLLGMGLNGIIVANQSSAAGAPVDASFRFAPGAIWLLALVLAIVSIVRYRGQGRLWPAYTTIAVVALSLLVAVPTMMRGRERLSVGLDATVAARELIARNVAFADVAATCVATHPTGCSARDLVATPGAERLALRLARTCSVALDFCLADGAGGGLHIELVSREVTRVGLLRVTTDVAPSGNMVVSCSALRPGTDPALEQAACGLGPTGTRTISAPEAARRVAVTS